MAKIALQKIDKSGTAKIYSAASISGDTFDSFDGVFVQAVNADAGATKIITIVAIDDPIITPEAGSLVVPDITVSVPASTDRIFSVPESHISIAGLVTMAYDDETQLSLGVFIVEQ